MAGPARLRPRSRRARHLRRGVGLAAADRGRRAAGAPGCTLQRLEARICRDAALARAAALPGAGGAAVPGQAARALADPARAAPGLGVFVIVAAKVLGTACVGRLFILVEPQLMTFAWFARAPGLVARDQGADRRRGSPLRRALAGRRGRCAGCWLAARCERRWPRWRLAHPPARVAGPSGDDDRPARGRGAPRAGAAPAAGRRADAVRRRRRAEWPAEIVRMGRSEVEVRIGGAAARSTASWRVAVTLAIGMPANERMDALVEKADRARRRGDPAAGLRALGAAPGRRARRSEARALAGGRGRGERAVRPHARAADRRAGALRRLARSGSARAGRAPRGRAGC